MKVVVTGGAGFIGRALIASLPPRFEVVVVDALVPEVHGAGAAFGRTLGARAHCVHCDVADVEAWRDAATGADTVIHLAALTGTAQSERQRDRYHHGNVTATVRLCDLIAANQSKPRRLVLASSRAVYGEGPYLDPARGDLVFPQPRRADDDRTGWEPAVPGRGHLQPVAASESMPPQPASLYAATKLAQERAVSALASRCGVAAVALRLQNVYGPGQDGSNPHAGVVAALARGILQDRSVELFEDGEMSRDFVHVDDVVRALRWAIEFDGAMPDVLNVGTGRRTPLRRLAELIDAHAGGGADIHCSGRLRAGDIRHAAADTTAWSAAFGSWTPVTLDGAMPAYLDWLAAQRVAASQP